MFLNPWYSGQQQNGSIPGVTGSSLPGITVSSSQPESGIGNSAATSVATGNSSSPSILSSLNNKGPPPPPPPPHQRNGTAISISASTTSNLKTSQSNSNTSNLNTTSGLNCVTFSNEVQQFSDNNSVYSSGSHGEANSLLVNGVTGVGVLQSENHYMLTSELGFNDGMRNEEGSLAGIGMANSLFPLSEEQNNHLQNVQRYLKPGWTVHLTPEGRYYYCK